MGQASSVPEDDLITVSIPLHQHPFPITLLGRIGRGLWLRCKAGQTIEDDAVSAPRECLCAVCQFRAIKKDRGMPDVNRMPLDHKPTILIIAKRDDVRESFVPFVFVRQRLIVLVQSDAVPILERYIRAGKLKKIVIQSGS